MYRVFLVVFLISFLNADDITRKCTKSDLIGAWQISHIKLIDKSKKDSLYVFLMKNQILVFKENDELKSLYTNDKPREVNDYLNLLEHAPGDTYTINDGGVISIFNNGKHIDSTLCQYFINDFGKANIQKGSISLMRFSNNQPVIGNVYKKIK